LAQPLSNQYDWRTVKVLANITPATHGETVTEILGSGDGLARNQRFKLKKPPLTFITGALGQETTLDVRVNNVLWKEQSSLLELTPRDESFIVRIEDDGTTLVMFGDGERGARLASGSENVVATYRSGLGPEGEVEAGQLALLKTKPLGIREVVNPLPATGAAPPEQEPETRLNAPLKVLVLGRVVSVQDYEDFSKTFPGIGKAQAVPMWDGYSKFVHLTIGTRSGDSLQYGSPLYESLRSALDQVRDTHQKMVIDGFEDITFGLSAKVMIDERYLPEPVLAAVRERLVADFSYDKRDLGQAVTASEILAAIHRIQGVVAVDLDGLFFVDGDPDNDDADAPTQRLPAAVARREAGVVERAELLLIDPTQITLEVMV
jgi:predicted phage baseplate assembly protein